MLMKKDVLINRIQKKLETIAKHEQEYEDSFAGWHKEKLAYEEAYLAATKAATSWDDFNDRIRTLPPQPEKPYNHNYFQDEKKKKLRRNLEVLKALEGDTIEVAQLKLSRNFGFEEIFGDLED
jgi:hypothetical protein